MRQDCRLVVIRNPHVFTHPNPSYEMMYGLPPFYNKNQTIMFKLIKEGELRFPERPETSKEAKDFISRV
jgi:hypothetical protein